MKKAAIFILLIIMILISFVACNSGSTNKQNDTTPTKQKSTTNDQEEKKQEEYTARDISEADAKGIAEAFFSGKAKVWIGENSQNVSIATVSKFKHETENGLDVVRFTVKGTYSRYDEYGSYLGTSKIDADLKISGSLHSANYDDIARYDVYLEDIRTVWD